MLRLPAPTFCPSVDTAEAGWPVPASTSPPAGPPAPGPPVAVPLRFTSVDMLIPFSPKLLLFTSSKLAASSRLRSLNDLFATISAMSGLDVRHSIGSISMCFLARGIGCRGSVVLPSSPELSVPVPPGPPSFPCLISSSMIFSSASCFCFFSCSFCWMFTRDPTLLPSFSLEPPAKSNPFTSDPSSTTTTTTTTSNATATVIGAIVTHRTPAAAFGAQGRTLLSHTPTRLVPETPHVEVAVVHDHEEQTGGEAAQHRHRHHVPSFRPVGPHAHHPQAHEQAVFRQHYHVECELPKKKHPVAVDGRVHGEGDDARDDRAETPEELEDHAEPGQHEPVHVLQAHVLAEAGERPAHAEQRQRGRDHVEVAERFLLLLGQVGLLHERRAGGQMVPERLQLQTGQLRLALQRHQDVQLEEQHRGCLAERVHEPQHAEVAHLVLHVPQVDRDEQFRVPPQYAELRDVQGKHDVPAVLGRACAGLMGVRAITPAAIVATRAETVRLLLPTLAGDPSASRGGPAVDVVALRIFRLFKYHRMETIYGKKV
uniref:Uncharacterized protein n=1 Tax=Anopheles atroparvus TaxID=41427 RepID=A0A182JBR8_ANOAO